MDEQLAEPRITIREATPEDWAGIHRAMKNWERVCQQAMNLHKKPMAEFNKMSVEDRRQALIEWKLQYDALSMTLGENGDPEPRWQFLKEETAEERARLVREYEGWMDSMRGHPGFELEEVKRVVEERRRALLEAVKAGSSQTLEAILSNPGFERYKLRGNNNTTLDINTQQFKLLGAERSYPWVLLYHLLNNPPDFLQRSNVPHQEQEQFIHSVLKERERIFINWLNDSAKNAKDGWLTLEMINTRNDALSPQKKIVRPKKYQSIDSNNIRGLLSSLRKYPEYAHAIETRAPGGQAWRLKDWRDRNV